MNEDNRYLDFFYCGLSRFYECQSCFPSTFSRKTLTIKTQRSELNKWFLQMNDNTIEAAFPDLGQSKRVAGPNDSSGNGLILGDKSNPSPPGLQQSPGSARCRLHGCRVASTLNKRSSRPQSSR